MNALTRYKFIANVILGFTIYLLGVSFGMAGDFKILSTEGRVEVSRDQESWKRVTGPTDVNSGTWIKTGPSGSATLVLPDKTQTRIAKNSELLLRGTKKKAGEVKLKLGKIWAKTNKKPVKIKIKAPNAVASIRGTEWVIEVKNNGQSSLAVMEGNIVLASNTGETKSIDGGSVAAVSKSGKISVAKLVNPGEYLQFVYRYQVEPLAYLPDTLIKTDTGGEIIRRLGAGSEKLSGSAKSLADQIKLGNFPSNFSGAPSEISQLNNYAKREQYLSIVYFAQPESWSSDWKDWLNAIKAESYLALGDDNRATKHINRISDSFTKNYIKSKQLVSKGFLDEAREVISPLADGVIKSAAVFNSLGEIEKAAGNIELARENFSRAYGLANHWHIPALRLASVALIQGNYDQAKEFIEGAKERNASAASLASNYAEYYSLRNNLDSASETLKFLTESRKVDFQMLTAKGIVELKKGESEKARDTLIEATALERNYSRAYSFMAVSHLHSGEPEVAFRQLSLAAKLDPNDPLPHVIASQIYAAMLNLEEASREAGLARDKTNGERSFGQLANDQQGGANVGRRFLEVGLPHHAREASIETRKKAWAGSYLFDAATARSGLERNSKYVMGFTLDSQTFGSRRDSPDIVSRPGDYGYTEYGAKLGNNDQLDLKFKYGKNGRSINGGSERSYLYDLGVYGAQRDAYYAPDDADTSLAALGFFGYGWRDNYDHNRFITANIVPFQTDGTFPVNDNTMRVDFGDSKRSDTHTRILHVGGELGDASIKLNVSTGCTGTDNQETGKLELGYAEIGRRSSLGQIDWSIEGSYATANSNYTVTHPSSASCTDIESETYQNRTETIKSVEYDIVASINLQQKIDDDLFHMRLKGYNSFHNFDQNRTLDSVDQTPFTSDRDINEFLGSVGYSAKLENTILRLGYITDYHPIGQVSLAANDIAGISSKFEFMKPGSEIEQVSARFATNLGDGIRTFLEYDEFTVHNNPIYLIMREQWNADLLENFTLNKYENPNVDDLFSVDNGFGAADFTKYSIAIEKTFSDQFSLSGGFESWEAVTLDHPNISDDTAGLRVSGMPESITYVGFTFALSNNGILSARFSSNASVYDSATSSASDSEKYAINYGISDTESSSQITVGLRGDLGQSSDSHVLSLGYRHYF